VDRPVPFWLLAPVPCEIRREAHPLAQSFEHGDVECSALAGPGRPAMQGPVRLRARALP
jgi:hypothetical protein